MITVSRMLGMSIVFSCYLVTGPVLADTSDEIKALKVDIKNLQNAMVQVTKDMDEIKKLLKENPRAAAKSSKATLATTDTELGDASYKGEYDAPVTLIEFSDYQCPYCRRHATTVMPTLIKKYVDTGKLRFVMREYPVEMLHRRALPASEAALCAGDQGRYWAMHDSLFADQTANTDEDFEQQAASLGLDVSAFSECMSSDKFMGQIQADFSEGQKLGVSDTPSFVVGLTDTRNPGTVHLTRFIRGAQSIESFSAVIDELIKTAELKK